MAARHVGGDYYDFLQVGDHSIGIALADVAGKGIAAALVMAVVQASLRIIAAESNVSLPELAAKMNRFLHRSTGFNSYATFFYAQVDEDKHQLRYVNAGHNPPYLVRALHPTDAPIQELASGGMIIGMFPFASYEESVVDLQPGDVLVAFTDGVTEALNPAEEEFGEERLKELIRRLAHLPVTEMTQAISRELRAWISTAPQHDDLTFVVMKVNV
ncbi:MAG: PP2C family protein-serine/threonine phosphatase [Acidobacteriaceae bacterium]|nr:PP2C family protein-serine/threonine phosphatase [Acidobacteriaceae bacterium]